MKLKGIEFKVQTILSLLLYFGIAQYLPSSFKFYGIGGKVRRFLCKNIFLKMGEKVNIERKANFGSGRGIIIGNNSGLGINCCIPSNTIIGNNVMMGPNCYILANNHKIERLDIPMIKQGNEAPRQTIIEDDCWIGRNVTMTPGRHISQGSVIGACCVLTKDFPEYSIVGGNPSKLIRSRKNKDKK